MTKLVLLLVVVTACGGGARKSAVPLPGEGSATRDPEGPMVGNPPPPPPPPGDGIKGIGPSTGGGGGGSVLTDGEIETVGSIDKSVVRKVVRENFEALRYCYEATLLANPNIAGTVVAKFTIQVDGTVHDVTTAGVHPDVESCVATKVKTFKFPKPDGNRVEVAYPFTFKPS